jgi:hypothetical protein
MPQFNLSDYETVQARIATFWEKYPDGAIRTHLESDPENFTNVVFFAEAYKHRDHPHPDATGYAAETKGSGGANNTAWHENGETSAIGRALANLGFATSHKERASREEMEKVNRMEEEPRPMRPPPRQTSRADFPQDREQLAARPNGNMPYPPTEKQWNFLKGLAADAFKQPTSAGRDAYLLTWADQKYNGVARLDELNKKQVSEMIEHLKNPDVDKDRLRGAIASLIPDAPAAEDYAEDYSDIAALAGS